MCIIRRSVIALGLGALLFVVPALTAASSSAGLQWAGASSPAVGNNAIVGVPQDGRPFLPARPQPVKLKEQVWRESNRADHRAEHRLDESRPGRRLRHDLRSKCRRGPGRCRRRA